MEDRKKRAMPRPLSVSVGVGLPHDVSVARKDGPNCAPVQGRPVMLRHGLA